VYRAEKGAKDDSSTFNWKQAQKDKCSNNLLSLMSQKDQMTALEL